MMENKAHYLENVFLIRDWNVEIKIQNYLGEKWTEPKSTLTRVNNNMLWTWRIKSYLQQICSLFPSSASRWIPANRTKPTNRLSTLPFPFTRAKHNGLNDGKNIMLWTVAFRLPVNKKTIIAPWVTRMTEWGKESEKAPEEVCQLGNFSSLFRS